LGETAKKDKTKFSFSRIFSHRLRNVAETIHENHVASIEYAYSTIEYVTGVIYSIASVSNLFDSFCK